MDSLQESFDFLKITKEPLLSLIFELQQEQEHLVSCGICGVTHPPLSPPFEEKPPYAANCALCTTDAVGGCDVAADGVTLLHSKQLRQC